MTKMAAVALSGAYSTLTITSGIRCHRVAENMPRSAPIGRWLECCGIFLWVFRSGGSAFHGRNGFAPQIAEIFNSEHDAALTAVAVPGLRIYFVSAIGSAR